MDLLSAIILGVIQGLTEFLPVSSSGHLVLAQKLIPGFSQPGILFDVILHFGTLAAVLYFFRKKLLTVSFRYLIFLAVGTFPAILVGLIFRKNIENMFSDPKFLGYEFLFTALLCFATDKAPAKKSLLNIKNSFLIGISQAIAIIPAISRSGATIFAGVRLGIPKKEVAEYSFLLSVPAILGANALEIVTHSEEIRNIAAFDYFAGFLASFAVGFASIFVVMKFLREGKFKFFGYYTLLLGLLLIFFLR